VNAQPSLFAGCLEDRFRRFHEQNPHVMTELVRLARQLKASGYDRYSIKGLWEVLRWRSE